MPVDGGVGGDVVGAVPHEPRDRRDEPGGGVLPRHVPGGRQPDLGAQRVDLVGDDLVGQVGQPHRADADGDVPDAGELGRHLAGELGDLADHEVRLELLDRRPGVRQRGPGAEPGEQSGDHVGVGLGLALEGGPEPPELLRGGLGGRHRVEAEVGDAGQALRPDRDPHLVAGGAGGPRERDQRVEVAEAGGAGEQDAHGLLLEQDRMSCSGESARRGAPGIGAGHLVRPA